MKRTEKTEALRRFIIQLLDEYTLPADGPLLLTVLNAMTNKAPYTSIDDIPDTRLELFV